LAHVNFAHLYASSATPKLGDSFRLLSGSTPLRVVNGESERFVPSQRAGVRWAATTEVAMSRELVWIDQERFRGFGCSACGWRFKPDSAPTGTSFEEMMRNFELQRDKEFRSHVCADHSKGVS
jgi:hypothetical protein